LKTEDLSDHDLLVELNVKMDGVIEANASLRKAMYGEDGQGGLCGRVSKLEQFQSTLVGIAITLSTGVAIIGNWIWIRLTGGS